MNIKIVLILVIFFTSALSQNMDKCYQAAVQFKNSYVHALERKDTDLIIDDLEQVFQAYPTLL